MSRQDSQAVNWRSSENENEGNPLSEWVTFIHARRVPELRFARWTVARAGWVATLPPERLQEEIDKKTEKINACKKRAEGIWLLIVADRTRPSQMLSVTPESPLNSVSSPFTKTFYYGHAAEEAVEFRRNETEP
jgi:hypothetical protein